MQDFTIPILHMLCTYTYTVTHICTYAPTCMYVNAYIVLFLRPSLSPQPHLQRQQPEEAEQACQIAIRQVNGPSP